MNRFESKNVDGLSANHISNVSSPINKSKSENELINMVSQESGIKPVELDDFFEFLDTKTVQKIMETSSESKARISKDIAQIEYDANGAQAILNSLG